MANIFDITPKEWGDFKREILDKIAQAGVEVEYYRAYACACSHPSLRQPRFSCEVCEGIGYAYDNIPEIIRVHMVNRKPKREFHITGQFDIGTAFATFPDGFIPSEWDKIFVKNELIVINNTILKRGEEEPEGHSLERVRFRRIHSIERVSDLNRTYFEGTDFEVINGRTISWKSGGNSPAYGSFYTMRYRVNPEYLIMGYEPISRLPFDVQFPYRAELRRLDRFDFSDDRSA